MGPASNWNMIANRANNLWPTGRDFVITNHETAQNLDSPGRLAPETTKP